VLLVAIENLVAGLAAPIICVQGLRWGPHDRRQQVAG
jgi:hypothetical protein